MHTGGVCCPASLGCPGFHREILGSLGLEGVGNAIVTPQQHFGVFSCNTKKSAMSRLVALKCEAHRVPHHGQHNVHGQLGSAFPGLHKIPQLFRATPDFNQLGCGKVQIWKIDRLEYDSGGKSCGKTKERTIMTAGAQNPPEGATK